jgi:hypothetical protein
MTAKQIDDVTPAFPANSIILPGGDIHWGEAGMSLRDYFAGQALVFTVGQFWDIADGKTAEHASAAAYRIADAMMEARKQ